jgi:dipeptidyl-peptidase-4
MTEAGLTFPRQHAATRRFTLGTPRNLAVAPDGRRVVFLRSRAGDDAVLCLWELDVSSGEERLVVDPHELAAAGAELPPAERARRERARESAEGIVSFSLDAEAEHAAFALGGSLFSVELSSGHVTGHDTDPGVFDPRIDPTGRRVAFVAGRELHLLDRTTDEVLVLASDPDPQTSWGRADFIAAEEMGRSRGFWWAPDGSSLLACCVSEALVDSWWIADPARPEIAPTEIRYPAAGTTNPAVALFHLGLDGGAVHIPWSDEGHEYLADVVWVRNHDPIVVRQTRDQREVSIVAVADLDTGAPHLVERRRIVDDVWVELIPGSPTPCEAGLLTVEDRADLDRRVLCLDGEPIALGGIEAHIRSIVDADDQRVIVTGWTDPTEIHVFSVSLSGDDHRLQPLTGEPGVHGAVASGATVVISASRPSEPKTSFEVRGHEPTRWIANHCADPVIVADPHFCRLGERELAAAVFLPSDHDGSPLPVLLDPYGGPHAQRVLRNHLGHLTSQWFADQGFAVLVTDNRGTPGRGPGFEREVWGDLAGPVLADQLDALDAAAERFGCLDLDRVGIRGWSFGGYLAALAALRAPERIHAAIAGAPVTSWRLYDTHYTERYLGHPHDHPDHYRRTDLIAEASSLTRPLLLIHGLADDNVVAAHTLQFSSALLAAGRAHHVLPLSGVTHMTPQEVVAENLLLLQRDFLRTHLSTASEAA